MSPEPVAVGYLQRALQWQYEVLRSNSSLPNSDAKRTDNADEAIKCKGSKEITCSTPFSLSSFDFCFDGVGNGQVDVCRGRETPDELCRLTKITDCEKCTLNLPQINDSSVHEFDCGGKSTGTSIQIVPKAAVDSLNFEIRVRHSAALPSNPWLSLPVDNQENSYTITIAPNPTPQRTTKQLQDPTDPTAIVNPLFGCRNQPTQTEVCSTQPKASEGNNCMLPSQSTLEDPEHSPVCHILSSTITEETNNSLSLTEGAPSLLWDSYDLHEQKQDSVNL